MAWNIPSPESGGKPQRKSSRRLVARIAAAVVAVGGAVAVWCLVPRTPSEPTKLESPSPSPPKAVKKPGPPKAARPKPAPADKPVAPPPKPAVAEPEEKWDDSFITNREKRIKFSKVISVTTNDSGVVDERFVLPNGKTWRRQIDPPPIFKSVSDNAIAMVIGGAAGAPIPPVPGLDDVNLDAAFTQSLVEPIEISPDDKPWVVALKLKVKDVREQIVELRRAGDMRPVGEILQAEINANNHEVALRAEAIQTLENVHDEMGEEAAAEYLEKVNEQLKKYGVQPVKIGRGRHSPETEGEK